MKNILTFIGSTMAAAGISLMAVSCGDKETTDAGNGGGTENTGGGNGGDNDKAASVDLEGQMVGYWAPDAESMMKELESELPDDPAARQIALPMMKAMVDAMTVQFAKGEVTFHVMGEAKTSTYKVTSKDDANKTLTVEITDDEGTESGTAKIDGDVLTLSKEGEPTITLNRIDEAEFQKRQEAAQTPPGLPEGLVPGGGGDAPIPVPTPPSLPDDGTSDAPAPVPAPEIPTPPTP